MMNQMVSMMVTTDNTIANHIGRYDCRTLFVIIESSIKHNMLNMTHVINIDVRLYMRANMLYTLANT